MKSKLAKRLSAVILSLTMCVGLLGTSVMAAGTVNEVKEKTGSGGRIVVTVYDQEPSQSGTGEQVDSGLSNPVEGVGINALRIGSVVELTSTDNGTVSTQVAFGLTDTFANLLGLNTNNAIASQNSTYYFAPMAVQTALGSATQADIEKYLNGATNGATNAVTGANGVATFDNLSYGLYLLAKSTLPADATTDLVPFLVSVPMYVESESGGDWQSTVYAYPKVHTDDIAISKTVDDQDTTTYAGGYIYVNAGQTLKYTVTATIPAAATGNASANEFTSFVITDTNTSKTLNVTTSSIGVQLADALLNGIDKTTYYSKTDTEKATYDYYYTYADDSNSVLTITFTDTGLRKINNNLNNAKNVVVTYNATVASDVTFSSKLTNTAKATYQREGMTDSADTEEAKVDLYTYGIDLTKTLSDSGNITGNTISFELYKTNNDGTLSDKVPVKSGTGGYWVAAAGESTPVVMYVAIDDKLNLYGLEPGTYYLKETATMTGYTLLAEPITIVITATDGQQGSDPTMTATVNGANAQVANGVVSLSVENTRNETGFALPQTGGAGTLLATAIGLGLLCAAVILLVFYRKKGGKNT